MIINFPLFGVSGKTEILLTIRKLYLTCSSDRTHQIVPNINKSEAAHEGHVTFRVEK